MAAKEKPGRLIKALLQVRKLDGTVNGSGSVKAFDAGTTNPRMLPKQVFGDGQYTLEVYDQLNNLLYTSNGACCGPERMRTKDVGPEIRMRGLNGGLPETPASPVGK